MISQAERDRVRKPNMDLVTGDTVHWHVKRRLLLNRLEAAERRVVRAAMNWRRPKAEQSRTCMGELLNACAALAKIEAAWRCARKQ